MESSMITGENGEECNSNESGWTMYLGSPVSTGNDAKVNDSEGSNVGSPCSNGRSKNNEDYDSLASDASTGPAKVKMHSSKNKVKMRNGKEKKGHGKNDIIRYENGNNEQEISTKLPISCDKKVGKMKKGEEKTTRGGYNKRRSSSRTSFFK